VRRPRHRVAALAAVAVVAGLLVPGTTAAAQEANAPIAFGAYLPDSTLTPRVVDRFGRSIGREPVIVHYYKQWDFQPFVRSELADVWRRGSLPMITWEPWSYEGRDYPLPAIARGRFDGYVRRAARAAASWDRPVLLRFAHEMNGPWYPWGQGRRGNDPALFKNVWRRLVRIFREEGATEVRWVWTPNVNGGGRWPFRRLYPGDAWVDWVGLDGYNWGLRGDWQSFTRIFGNSYNALTRLTDRPMIVGETGSSQSGGDKAAWLASALGQELPRFSRIRAVVWFNAEANGIDWRLNSSPAALRAFRAGISSPRYDASRASFLATPADLAARSSAPAAPSGGFGEPSFFSRITQKLHGRYLWIAIGVGAGLLVLLGVAIAVLRKTLRARAAR